MVGGYTWDHFLGDSDYTAREAVVDASMGAVGGSVLKPMVKGTSKLGKGLWRYHRGGGAVTQIPRREVAETVGYLYGREAALQVPKFSREIAVGLGVGIAYDRYSQSGASSSSSYQQSGGAPGTIHRRFKDIDSIPAGSRVVKPSWRVTSKHPHGGTKKGHHYCKKGWLLVRVGDTNMCWKPPRKNKS